MERKIWIIAKLSKEHTNEKKKKNKCMNWNCITKEKSSLRLSFSLKGSEENIFN